MQGFTYAITDTRSGVVQAPIDPAPDSFKRAVSETATNQTVLPIDASPFTAAELDELTEEWSRSVVVSLNGKSMYSGVIQDFDWDEKSGLLTLNHSDSRVILESRTTFGTNGYSGNLPTQNNLVLPNIALAAVPAWLVWAGTEGPTPNFDLPVYIPEGKITLPLLQSLSTPGPYSFVYWDYEVNFIDEAIDRLHTLGIETDFEGRWSPTTGAHELLLRSGTLTGGTYEFNLTAPKCPISNLRVRRQAARQANVVYSIGKGSEQEMRVTTSRDLTAPIALELAESFKEIDDVVILQANSDTTMTKLRSAIVQWDFDIPITFDVGIENIRLGSLFRVYSRGHKVITDGWHGMRYLGFDINPVSGMARVTVQKAV